MVEIPGPMIDIDTDTENGYPGGRAVGRRRTEKLAGGEGKAAGRGEGRAGASGRWVRPRKQEHRETFSFYILRRRVALPFLSGNFILIGMDRIFGVFV